MGNSWDFSQFKPVRVTYEYEFQWHPSVLPTAYWQRRLERVKAAIDTAFRVEATDA